MDRHTGNAATARAHRGPRRLHSAARGSSILGRALRLSSQQSARLCRDGRNRMGHGSTAMARNLLVMLAMLAAFGIANAASTEPAPSQAAKPLVATVPDWKAVDDDPLPPNALLRIGSRRAVHGVGSNIVSSKDGK